MIHITIPARLRAIIWVVLFPTLWLMRLLRTEADERRRNARDHWDRGRPNW